MALFLISYNTKEFVIRATNHVGAIELARQRMRYAGLAPGSFHSYQYREISDVEALLHEVTHANQP